MPHRFPDCLREGVTLFDTGAFHAAHDVWEDGWRVAEGPRRALLQGLILVAAGWLKREAGNPVGPQRLFSRALDRLSSLPARYEGVDVEGLRQGISHWRTGEHTDRPLLARWVTPEQGASDATLRR